MDMETLSNENKLSSLEKQWEYLSDLADSYERRNSTISFPAFAAMMAAVVALCDWLPKQSPFTQKICLIAVPLCILGIVAWMACNFRRQAMVISYLKKIEEEINDLFSGDKVYRWQEIYAEYDDAGSKRWKMIWKNPRNAFILTSAALYLLITTVCVYITIISHFSDIYKAVYIAILTILTLLVYPSLDNSHVR